MTETTNKNYEVLSSVGERIKEIRKNLKLTQGQFSKESGISQSHLSSIENGKDNPSTTLIKLISIKYNISESWLISGIGSFDTVQNDYSNKYVMLKHIEDMYAVLEEMKNLLLSDDRTFNI